MSMRRLLKDLTRGFGEPHERLFVEREYAAVRGRKGRVASLLLAMVLATLFVVVLARSGMAHLRRSMSDPFTRLVSINVRNASHGMNYDSVQHYLQECARQGRFQADTTSGSYSDLWFFHSQKNSGDEMALVVSFGFWQDKDLLHRIVQQDNLVHDLVPGGVETAAPETYTDGIIISKEFQDAIGCDVEVLKAKRLLMVRGGYTVPLRVLAVVHTLPERARCLAEHALVMDLVDMEGRNVFPFRRFDALRIVMDARVQEDEDTQQRLSDFFGEEVFMEVEDVNDIATHTKLVQVKRSNGLGWTTDEQRDWHLALTDVVHSKWLNLRPAVWFEDVRLHQPDSTVVYGRGQPEYYRFDQLTISFHSLDSIGEFQRDIQERTRSQDPDDRHAKPVQLDLHRVEAQKNFAMVAGLGNFLLSAMVLFALMAILLYLYNLLRNHLDRMRMNLGTFMAFGLSPGFIQAGYLRIIFRLLLRVFCAAILLLLLFQGMLWVMVRSGWRLPGVLEHVSVLTDPWLFVCAIAILGSSLLICHHQLARFLAIPPGDLIYDRK